MRATALWARPAAVLAVLAVAACEPGVLNPRGTVGIADRQILIDSLAIMLAIVVPTIAAIAGCAWWFRASNPRARYLPQWAYSGRIELIVWFIPALVIILLGGVAWIGAHQLDPKEPLASGKPALEVQAVSLDWKWLFIYPAQNVASVNQLVVPAGVPIHFSLTSASVMNAFFIPQLGSMIYTMNGMVTQLNLRADAPGFFRGQSSHYSGDGFSDMQFGVRAVSGEEFTAWIGMVRKTGPMLDEAAYTALAKQSMNVDPSTFRTVDAGLFQKIATEKLPPGPGPQSGAANASISPKAEN